MVRVYVGLELRQINRIAVIKILELRSSLHAWTTSHWLDRTRRRAIALATGRPPMTTTETVVLGLVHGFLDSIRGRTERPGHFLQMSDTMLVGISPTPVTRSHSGGRRK